MARRTDTAKNKEPDGGKPRTQSKEERKQARAKGGSGTAGAPKAGRPKAARAKGARAASGEGETAIEARLARLEQAVALQAERSEELLEKVEAVLGESNE